MFDELDILKPFFDEPSREFNVREIARILGVSPATASSRLKELEKMKLLKKRKQNIFDFYKAYSDSDRYRDVKVFYNTSMIRESGLIETLNKTYLKPAIVLFGSAAHGKDTSTSDFDILVISEKIQKFGGERIFEKKLNRKLHIFVVKNIKDIKNEHLVNNILNGIVLQGSIKWI